MCDAEGGEKMIDTERLKAIMAERNLSHATLARLAGVSRPAVTKLLLRQANPRISTVGAIAKALDLKDAEIVHLFFGDGSF